MQKIALTLFSSLTLIGCSSEKKEAMTEKAAIPVIAVHPTIKDIPVYIESIGTFHPSVNMEIQSQISGILAEVYVREGQWVKKSTPLMKIDSRIYEVKVREAEAQIRIDRVESDAAQKKIERFRKLAQRDLVAQVEWDEIVTHADKARAILNLTEAHLESIKLDLENCTLTSPIDGRVGKLDVHPGSLISGANSQLITISQMDPLLIEFTVTQQELAKIPTDHPVVEIQALCGSSFGERCATGSITFLDNHFDLKTGQLLVRGKLENPEFAFRPGQMIKLRIPISISPGVMLIPQKAVRYNEQGTYVYIVDIEKTTSIRQIILGEESGKDVIVLEGITPSDIIVTDGHLRVNPGSKVDVHA